MANKKNGRVKKQQSHTAAGKVCIQGEAMGKIPDLITVRLQATTEENTRYAEEKKSRESHLTVAKRLNWITGIGVICAVLSLVGVFLAIYQSHSTLEIDQRAWIGPGDKIASLPGDSDVQPVLVMQIINTGKTPALDTRIRVSVDQLLTVPGTPNLSQKPEFPEDSSKVNTAVALGIVMPNSEFPVTARIITRPTGSWAAPGAKFIHYLHGRVDYEDAFGISHWWDFCYFRESILPSEIHWQPCDEHNETDKNRE